MFLLNPICLMVEENKAWQLQMETGKEHLLPRPKDVFQAVTQCQSAPSAAAEPAPWPGRGLAAGSCHTLVLAMHCTPYKALFTH